MVTAWACLPAKATIRHPPHPPNVSCWFRVLLVKVETELEGIAKRKWEVVSQHSGPIRGYAKLMITLIAAQIASRSYQQIRKLPVK